MFGTKFYISTQGEDGVKNFKYKGGSDSILYTYVWSPLCNWIVENWMPKWIAPNVITSIGFLIHVFVHLLVMIYSPNLQNNLPSWICVLMGFALFSYQILDNLDGKQARATGSSSPLGMLFDHGCDAVATWMVVMNTLAILQIESIRFQYYVILFIGLIPFYFAMWSQYHLGVFRLGYINAVDEGLVLTEVLYIATGIFGQQIWSYKIEFLGFTTAEAMLISTFFMSVLQIIQFSNDLYKAVPFIKFLDALKLHFCTILLILTFISVDIFIGIEFISQHFLLFIYSLCFAWSKIIGHIQLAHITEEKFDQWRYSYLFVNISYILSGLYCYATGSSLQNIVYLIYFNFFIAFVCYSHFVYCVFNHLADILGIYIFRIGKRENNLINEKGFISLTKEENTSSSQ
ncbi:hypothetical protein ABPG74_016399 [Tetrahymena malaccensis]